MTILLWFQSLQSLDVDNRAEKEYCNRRFGRHTFTNKHHQNKGYIHSCMRWHYKSGRGLVFRGVINDINISQGRIAWGTVYVMNNMGILDVHMIYNRILLRIWIWSNFVKSVEIAAKEIMWASVATGKGNNDEVSITTVRDGNEYLEVVGNYTSECGNLRE